MRAPDRAGQTRPGQNRLGPTSLLHLLWQFLHKALASPLHGSRARAWLSALVAAAVTAGGAQADRDPPGPYIYGVIPYITAIELARLHAPVLAEIQRVLGRPVTFHTTSSLDMFTARLKQQAYDIAFIQPYDYHAAVVESGYIPLARMDGQHRALIVVVPSSPLRSVRELRGKTLALPPPKTATCYLASTMLRQAGPDPQRDLKLRHYKSHGSCLQQALIGTADACATNYMALQAFQSQRRVRFRVLGESMESPGPLFVVHPRVPSQEREALQGSILSWADTRTGKQLLQAVGLEPFSPSRPEDAVAYEKVTHCAEDS